MNDFISIIKADWNNGIWQNKIKFIVPPIVAGIACGNFLNNLHTYFRYKRISEHASLLECLMYIFKGMKVYNPNEDKLFELPIVFVVLNLYLAYLIGDYAVHDLGEYGLQMLLKTGSKIKWWVSKCIWNMTTVFLFYVSILIGTICVWVIFGKTDGSLFSFHDTVLNFIFGKSMNSFALKDIMLFYALLMLTSAAISLWQMVISLYLTPLVSFILVAVLFIVSGYYMSNLLLGNYMMLCRSGGVDAMCGLWIDIAMIIVGICGGYILFRKRDLL